jgi:hypothetical protein
MNQTSEEYRFDFVGHVDISVCPQFDRQGRPRAPWISRHLEVSRLSLLPLTVEMLEANPPINQHCEMLQVNNSAISIPGVRLCLAQLPRQSHALAEVCSHETVDCNNVLS